MALIFALLFINFYLHLRPLIVLLCLFKNIDAAELCIMSLFFLFFQLTFILIFSHDFLHARLITLHRMNAIHEFS